MKLLKKYKIVVIVFVLVIFLLGLVCLRVKMNKMNSNVSDDSDLELIEDEKNSDTKEEDSDLNETKEVVSVDIKGAVTNPGVYEVESDKKVIDVINLAGGLKDDANTSLINLAKKVSDEMVVIIYTEDEIKEASKDGSSVIKPVDSVCTCPKITNDACLTGSDDDDSSSNSSSSSTSTTDTNSKVNINTATIEELETLSGIGESKAKAIIAYREENGNFTSIEDILNVSGIGESVYEKIKDSITV